MGRKDVILTGGSGFLGREVSGELALRGFRVHATVHSRPLPETEGMFSIAGGIRGLTARMIDETGPAAIFHCARPTLPRFRTWGRIIAAWQTARLNRLLVSRVAESNVKPALIFASGSLVYGNSSLPHGEDAALNPVSYAREYHRGEIPIVEAAANPTLNVTVMRLPWLLGNGSWFAWFYLRPLRETGKVPLFGDGSNRMSLISLADAARLMVRNGMDGTGRGICNIVTPHVMTQREFAELVAARFNGVVRDFREIFPGGVEKAVFEAFTSDIVMTSGNDTSFRNFSFEPPDEVLRKINAGTVNP
jgi:nucleoside-diphosphate-sugar epimerase